MHIPNNYPLATLLDSDFVDSLFGLIQSLAKLLFLLWLPTVASSVPNAEAVRDNMAAD